MSTDTRKPQFNLVEKILQTAVGLILDSSSLLVLIQLQSCQSYQTDKSISEAIGMPVNKVSNCLKQLQEQKFIGETPFFEMNGDRRKNSTAYIIKYKETIENIVFKYCKIVNNYDDSRKVDEASYMCPRDGYKYSYIDAMDYYDTTTHRMFCPNCDTPLVLVEDDHNHDGNQKLSDVKSQLKPLRDLLEQLSIEYRSVGDYPSYSLPPNAANNGKESGKKNGKRRERMYESGILSRRKIKVSSGLMPWEYDEEEEKKDEVSQVMENSEEDLDIYSGIEYSQYRFLTPDKAFHQKESQVVFDSQNTSPVSLTVVKAKPRNGSRKAIFRSVSATPQML
ncbi:hypothetical protein EDI_202580 [Entamoeba dispar SAW760]|uniref:Transcription initiation factor IIE subunit alpha n=1 Tax=Entamoeba dispar (strain ATCC PRA-260 / SAW760) TaxID=370354 RepID=B0ET83_ENTDS|nr:uncharacterized protein EDI_202580 [Entamoeba dispar SAW760]EDR22243.1 hypothetical protein EDI_202580 [Entamoeba dispar SAW760]|eukprot:EDR22243.1 hypothetical protein EDI_202580 [Entamoeba dispar SAW760]